MGMLSEYSIMVVDDDPFFLKQIDRILKPAVKKVYACNNGQEALKTYIKHRPQIIMTDYEMPRITGLDLTRKIRTNQENTPIIMLSGSSTHHVIKDALNSGVDYFLEKPCKKDELKNALITCKKKLTTTIKPDRCDLEQAPSSVRDHSGHLFVVTDGEKILDSNPAFLKFFHCKDLNDFIRKNPFFYQCFKPNPGCLYPRQEAWLSHLLKQPEERQKISFKNKMGHERKFIVKSSELPENGLHAVTFTDITNHELRGQINLEKELPTGSSWKDVMMAIGSEQYRAKRYHIEFSVIMLGISDYSNKALSKNYDGEDIAHRILQRLIRPTDSIHKLNTSEYIILAPHTDSTGCNRMMERLMQELVMNEILKRYEYQYKMGCATYEQGKEGLVRMVKRLQNSFNKAKRQESHYIEYAEECELHLG